MRHLTCPIAILLLTLATASSLKAEVTISGFVYFLDREGAYHPLPGAQVAIFRQHKRLPMATADGIGHFTYKLDPGTPFMLAVHANEKVLPDKQLRIPQIQQLAGKDNTVNQFHVTLLTIKQYQDLHAGAPLADKLNCILKELTDDSPQAQIVRDAIMALINRLNNA